MRAVLIIDTAHVKIMTNNSQSRKDGSDMYELVKYEVKGDIAYITANNPKVMNCLSGKMLDELYGAFNEAEDDAAVKVVIFTGEGKAFIAGADISEMATMSVAEGQAYSALGHKLAMFIEGMSKPVIAAINGFALGGGCEMAMSCDIRLASTAAKFGQPEVGLGLTPGYGGCVRLQRLIGKGMAKKLIFTGAMIGAEDALKYGLVEDVYEPEELLPAAEKLAGKIAKQAPFAVAVCKKIINNVSDMDVRAASAFEIQGFTSAFATEDRIEGTAAFVEKRKPNFQGK